MKVKMTKKEYLEMIKRKSKSLSLGKVCITISKKKKEVKYE